MSRQTPQGRGGPSRHAPLVSVVVPTLNDSRCLAHALASIGAHAEVETIVVNGGAHSAEIDALQRQVPWARWTASPPGRGRQMNVGAAIATGTWLLFLHADTTLTAEWLEEIQRIAKTPAVGGSFRFRLASERCRARLLERGVALRVRWFDLPYGDQGLFVRREVFATLGGFRELPLMEDVDFMRRLARAGPLCHSALPAVTSARRWEADGWVWRSVANVVLVMLYFLGVSPAWLARRYRGGRSATP